METTEKNECMFCAHAVADPSCIKDGKLYCRKLKRPTEYRHECEFFINRSVGKWRDELDDIIHNIDTKYIVKKMTDAVYEHVLRSPIPYDGSVADLDALMSFIDERLTLWAFQIAHEINVNIGRKLEKVIG